MTSFYGWMRRIARRPAQADLALPATAQADQARSFADCIRMCSDPMNEEFQALAERERQRYLAEMAAGR